MSRTVVVQIAPVQVQLKQLEQQPRSGSKRARLGSQSGGGARESTQNNDEDSESGGGGASGSGAEDSPARKRRRRFLKSYDLRCGAAAAGRSPQRAESGANHRMASSSGKHETAHDDEGEDDDEGKDENEDEEEEGNGNDGDDGGQVEPSLAEVYCKSKARRSRRQPQQAQQEHSHPQIDAESDADDANGGWGAEEQEQDDEQEGTRVDQKAAMPPTCFTVKAALQQAFPGGIPHALRTLVRSKRLSLPDVGLRPSAGTGDPQINLREHEEGGQRMLLVQLEPHVERKHRVAGCKTGPFWFPADLLHKESKRFYAERGVWPQVVSKITSSGRSAHHVNIMSESEIGETVLVKNVPIERLDEWLDPQALSLAIHHLSHGGRLPFTFPVSLATTRHARRRFSSPLQCGARDAVPQFAVRVLLPASENYMSARLQVSAALSARADVLDRTDLGPKTATLPSGTAWEYAPADVLQLPPSVELTLLILHCDKDTPQRRFVHEISVVMRQLQQGRGRTAATVGTPQRARRLFVASCGYWFDKREVSQQLCGLAKDTACHLEVYMPNEGQEMHFADTSKPSSLAEVARLFADGCRCTYDDVPVQQPEATMRGLRVVKFAPSGAVEVRDENEPARMVVPQQASLPSREAAARAGQAAGVAVPNMLQGVCAESVRVVACSGSPPIGSWPHAIAGAALGQIRPDIQWVLVEWHSTSAEPPRQCVLVLRSEAASASEFGKVAERLKKAHQSYRRNASVPLHPPWNVGQHVVRRCVDAFIAATAGQQQPNQQQQQQQQQQLKRLWVPSAGRFATHLYPIATPCWSDPFVRKLGQQHA